ncbi:hypothetical protein BO94DRAFT_547970 [Aspergillus sclerotioniger CBS 115572]|uniref:Uncharacterized protein n=1 Tax=Aspergillus sclerotioniger CBS 115572 TaxID=1450535 RepID=A0A317W741_9EURO|nr:hypothetical protein BO94DRAFT_547970 [Aspergillus sclerotioniger CBS 115572]PWY81705.1 hypothetical protein BO94DRAFT_547970 [Aspergillus sclerotioniger CBS 115572]
MTFTEHIVYWDVKPFDDWFEPSDAFTAQTGITHWAVSSESRSGIYRYILWIFLESGASGFGRDYRFVDESGDTYCLTCWTDGNHSLNYNSDKPNIVRVFAEDK